MRLVDFLRSHLLIVIVSLFVLTGHAHDALDFCCTGEKQEQVAQSETAPAKNAPLKSDDCQCLCHQVFIAHAAPPMSIAPALHAPADFVTPGAEFPPEAVPLGIDYPPQLA